jgi:hypothetical protein
VSASGGRLQLWSRGSPWPGCRTSIRPQVAQLLNTSVELPELPFGLQVLGVDVDAGGVVLRVGGTGVVLTPS